jgi:glycosyltransferase involved in cell wall biosynthesis
MSQATIERSAPTPEETRRDLPCVAVVIPAYQAAAHIQTVLVNIPRFVRHIIVVDDRSPDNTGELVKSWHDTRVHLIVHTHNQGVGGAVLSGYAAALGLGAEIIVKMDSDDQMDPAFLPALVAPILRGEADYAKGNRFFHMRQLRTMPLARRLGNLGLSFLMKLASGYWNIFDPTNGYTAIHASVVPMLDQAAIDRRYFFESSMLLELSLVRAVVRDVSIPARYGDEVSSLSVRNALFAFPARLLRGLMRRLWIQYFVRDFGLFSVFLLAAIALTMFGVLFGAYHWLRSAQLDTGTPTGTVMLAVLPIILGIQFMLQAITLDVQSVPVRPVQEHAPPPGWRDARQQHP